MFTDIINAHARMLTITLYYIYPIMRSDFFHYFSKNSEDWTPTKNTRICSIHFVNNAKSEHPLHPSYVPSMFSEDENISKRIQSLRRFERLQYRKSQKDLNNKGLISVSGESHSNKINDNASNIRIEQDEHADRSELTIARPAQTETIMDDMSSDSTYLFGNRNYRDGLSTAAVQTNIPMKKTLDKMCQASISILKNNVRDFGCNPMTEINKSSC